MTMRNISYSHHAFDDSDVLIANAKRALKSVEYDTMIGTGISGAIVVPILGRALGKKWAIIRKPDERSHSTAIFEGEIGDRWLFVDDGVASGNTYRRVIAAVEKAADRYRTRLPVLVGAYEYEREEALNSPYFDYMPPPPLGRFTPYTGQSDKPYSLYSY